MYNKEKKGFTLVELLAVIVILGILALITTPLVLNTIESTRLGAAKTGATNYVTILEDELVKQQVLHPEEEIGSGKYEVLKDGKYKVGEEVKTLQVKGELPSEGTICVDDNGNVDKYSVVIGSYVVSNITGEQEIEVGTKALNITCDISKETVKMSIKGNANLCEKEKVVVIEYPNIDRVEKQYSFDKETWYTYEGEISVRKNTTIYARVYDGESAGVTSSIIISKADNEQVSKTSPSVKLSNTKPTSVIEANIRQTDNCSLDTNTIEYGISDKEEGPYKYGKNNVFEGLKNNTIYYIKTRANDIAGNGVVESETSKITTGDFGAITLEPNIVEWSTSKKIKITGETSGSTLEYRVRKYNFDEKNYEVSNWESYKDEITLNSMATSEYPTTVYARFNDGVNTSREATLTVTKIDTTVPTEANFTYMKSTNSLTLKASGTDSETGIAKYQFSIDGGSNWTSVQDSNTYTFNNLKTGNYNVKVRVYNGTYETGGRLYKDSDIVSIDIEPVGTCSISVTNDGLWSTSKEVTVTKTGSGTLQYRIVSGTTEEVGWTNYSSAATVNWIADTTTPTNIYCRVTDGTNTLDGATKSITKVDITPPTSASFTTDTTTNSIKVVASATDNESGIAKYQFSSDGGTNWTSVQDSNTYTFSGIKTGSYNIKVRAYNGTYGTGGRLYIDSDTRAVATSSLGNCSVALPTPSSWSTSKTVSISKTGNGTIQYKIGNGTWNNYTGALTLTSNESVYCRLTDGINIKSGDNIQTITTIDRTKPAKPTVSLKLGSTSGSNYTSGSWTNQDVWHIVNSSDVGSGIAYYQYSYDGSSWGNDISTLGWGSSYSNGKNQLSYRINWEGQWNFYIRAVDNAGNVSDASNMFTVRIDKTAPGCSWSGESSSWTNSSRTISVTCANSSLSGCASTGSWSYTSGVHTTESLSYTVYDHAGNTSVCSKTASVYVDKVAPVIVDDDSHYYNSSCGQATSSWVDIYFWMTENGSGISYCQWRCSNSDTSWQTDTKWSWYTAADSTWVDYKCHNPGKTISVNFREGAWGTVRNDRCYYRCVDNAGNVSNETWATINITK